MSHLESRPELRNDDTIRAYLEELARLKTPVQLWLPVPGAVPFETTLEQVGLHDFSTTTTPVLEPGQPLRLAFMLDAQRLVTQTQVVAQGFFRIPSSISHGERRAQPRAPFDRKGDRAEVLLIERVDGTFLGGRILQGRLLDLSERGLRLNLDEFDVVSGPVAAVEPGTRFDAVRVSGLPHMPAFQCRGTLTHLTGTTGGLHLEAIPDADRNNLARILEPRYPHAFGQGFPARKRKTDLADRPGTPTPRRVKAKPAEVVEQSLEAPPPEPPPPPVRLQDPPVLRIRKAVSKVLLLSAQGTTQALAEAFRQDGFKTVVEARSFVEVQNHAARVDFDLLLLDNTMSGHWGKDMMKALYAHNLLVGTPIILLVECRNPFSEAIAEALDAMHIHERRESYEGLRPVLAQWLMADTPPDGPA